MSVRLGDIVGQIGSGTYKLVNAKDIDIANTTDGTSDGAMDLTDLLICDTDGAGAVKKISISQLSSLVSGVYQPLDAELTSLAGLSYVADSFIKMTGANTFALRTIAETKTDLSLNLVENTALSSWAGTTNITTVGSITGNGTAIFEGASVTIGKASTTTGSLVLHDSNSANTITLTVPDISAGSLSFTLPATDGDNTNVLQTNGSGVLSWVAGGGCSGTITIDNMFMNEQAAADADVAGDGQFWVKTETPNTPWFTNDAGDDHQLMTYVDNTDSTIGWDHNSLTVDGNWYDLDCSSIVPLGTKAINFMVYFRHPTAFGANVWGLIRKNGNTNTDNVIASYSYAANIVTRFMGVVACDSSRKCEYNFASGMNLIGVCVMGWFV